MKTNKFITVSSAVLLSAGMLGAVSAVNENNSVQTVQAAKKKSKKFSYSKFRKKIMKKCHISKKLVDRYTAQGYYHTGNIADAIKHPTRYVRYRKGWGYVGVKKHMPIDEYYVAKNVLQYRSKKNKTKKNSSSKSSSSKKNTSSSITVDNGSSSASDSSKSKNSQDSSKKSSSAEAFKQKVMSEAGITEEQFNEYTNNGYYHDGDIADAIKNPYKYATDDHLRANDNVTGDEFCAAEAVLDARKITNGDAYDPDEKVTLDDNWRKDVADYFINFVNDWRKGQGLPELKTGNALLQKAADTRATELLVQTGHTRPDGRQWYTVDQDVGLPDARKWQGPSNLPYTDEACGYGFGARPAKAFAKGVFNEMVYNDAASNWGHRDSLKSTRVTQIAVGVAYKKANNSEYNLTLEVKLIS